MRGFVLRSSPDGNNPACKHMLTPAPAALQTQQIAEMRSHIIGSQEGHIQNAQVPETSPVDSASACFGRCCMPIGLDPLGRVCSCSALSSARCCPVLDFFFTPAISFSLSLQDTQPHNCTTSCSLSISFPVKPASLVLFHFHMQFVLQPFATWRSPRLPD